MASSTPPPPSRALTPPEDIKFIGVARSLDRTLVASLTVQRGDIQDQYHTAVREVLSAQDFAKKVTPGARYRLVGDINAFNFTTDAEQRVYIVIAAQAYPERLAFQLITELVQKFKQEFSAPSLTCVAGALDGKAKRLFTALAEDYDDPTKRDRLAQVHAQVQDVKGVVAQNLDKVLGNITQASEIEESSKRLSDQAQRFDMQARTLKNRELWRKYKITCFIGLGVLVLIGILILAFKPWEFAGGGSSPSPAYTNAPVPVSAPGTPQPAAASPPTISGG